MNFTLIGEMITFAILVWVTMKYIWPPILKAMQEREKKIADGLDAAERGQNSLELAKQRVKKQLQEAKVKASDIVDEANMRAAKLIEEGKGKAGEEAKKILTLAQSDIATETEKAKQQLRGQIANLVFETSKKVLQRTIDEKTNRELVDQFIEEI